MCRMLDYSLSPGGGLSPGWDTTLHCLIEFIYLLSLFRFLLQAMY